ncbi:MAG: DUF4129 domain-containing protein [Balneolaceae bacterium]
MKIEVGNFLAIKLLIGAILLLVNFNSAFAQDSLATIPHDSSEVTPRTADQQTLKEITDEQVFAYNETAQNPETLWSRIQRWLFQTIISILDNKWASFFIKFAFFATFGIVLVALINQLLGGNLQSAFSTRQKTNNISLKTGETNFTKTDLDKLLGEALAENRFSDAVRILYLQTLQELNNLGLISLKPDKTNHDYLRELDQHATAPFFFRLTLFYEYVEYGNFKIEKSGFEQMKEIHEQFKEMASSQ